MPVWSRCAGFSLIEVYSDPGEVLACQNSGGYFYETDHIFRLSDDQDTSLLRAAYEGCPIATEDIGHLGVVDGQWIFATDIQTTSFRANGEPEQYLVSCYIIPDEQATILERYLQ